MVNIQVIRLAEVARFTLGVITVTPAARMLAVGANELAMEPRVMQVLITLSRQRGEVVGREALIDACWDGRTVGEDAINRAILKLRRALHEIGGDVTIETVAKVGYRLCVGEIDAMPERPPTYVRARGPLWLLGGMVAVASLLLALLLASELITAHSHYRVAVRNFEVAGENADMGASLADRIMATLNDRQFPVVSRARIRQGGVDGAHYVVGGAIRRVGPDLRVDIHLDDARSGLTLWEDSFVRSASESDALQDQVASKVADIMNLTRDWLGPSVGRVRPEAVEVLIKATDAMRGGTARAIEAREAFRRFRDLAPTISRAHSAFAMASALAAPTQPLATAARWRSEARGEALRAIELNTRNAEGYLALSILTDPSDLVQRQRWIARGLAIDPENTTLCNFNGELLLNVGFTEEALLWLKRSLMLDPISPPKTQSLISALSVAGRFTEAAAMFPRAERLWPDDTSTRRTIVLRSLIYAPPGRATDSLERLQASSSAMPTDHAVAWRRYEAARSGTADRIDTARCLAALLESATGDEVDALVASLASLKDADDAFRSIDRLRKEQRDWSTSTLFEPATATLRNDSRFSSVAQQLGLTRYWVGTGIRPDICAAGSVSATVCSD